MDGQLILSDLVAGDGGAQGEMGILTLPNVITTIRLLLIPVYLWLLFGRQQYGWAGLLLGTLGATDFLDGQLARRLGQVSTLGKVLDPVADRILVVTAVISVAWVGAVPWWFAGATLAREVLVSGATLLLASMGAARIDVLFIGKAGTFALMTAYPFFLFGHGPGAFHAVFEVAAWVIGLVGLTLAWIAAASYVGPARAALRDGRKGRQSPRPD